MHMESDLNLKHRNGRQIGDHFKFMDFSLLSPLEFFVDPKNVDGRNN